MTFSVKNLTYAGLCLALSLLLPFLTGQIPEIGSALSPMHIPVLLCGYLCGGPMAAVIGFIAPLLRNLLFGMPPLFPTGVAMAFELATYGFVTSLLYSRLPKKTANIYISLVAAMLAGRVVWGVVRVVLAGMTQSAFTWSAFMAGAFINAIPGIICHILLVPVLVIALKKARLIYA